jgi:hypothetical protein
MLRVSTPLFLLALAGCDSLTVHPYAGTIVQMTWSLSGDPTTPPDHHLELWTRDANNAIIRVDGAYTYNANQHCDACSANNQTLYQYGLMIRPAVTFDDPCLIDNKGNLLVLPGAYQTKTVNGVTQTPEQQAQQVKNRIAQVTSTSVTCSLPGCTDLLGNPQHGKQSSTLFAVVPYTPTGAVNIPADSPPSVRLAACQLYWKDPLAYTGNPGQLTAPVNGAAYGFLSYTTVSPPSGYDGIRIDSPSKLKGAQELWLTDETIDSNRSMVDPMNRGPIFLQGFQTPGGIDVQHFDLVGPTGSGTAALEVNLDDDSVVF